MKFTRTANANWKGSGMEGKGLITTQSTTLDKAQLSFKTRFEEGVGTNPEELIAHDAFLDKLVKKGKCVWREV